MARAGSPSVAACATRSSGWEAPSRKLKFVCRCSSAYITPTAPGTGGTPAAYPGLRRDGRVAAVLLVYAPPGFTSLVPCGEPDGVAALLAAATRLPAEATTLLRRSDLPAVEA